MYTENVSFFTPALWLAVSFSSTVFGTTIPDLPASKWRSVLKCCICKISSWSLTFIPYKSTMSYTYLTHLDLYISRYWTDVWRLMWWCFFIYLLPYLDITGYMCCYNVKTPRTHVTVYNSNVHNKSRIITRHDETQRL